MVLLDHLVEVCDDVVLRLARLPRRLVVRQVAPLDEVPRRAILHHAARRRAKLAPKLYPSFSFALPRVKMQSAREAIQNEQEILPPLPTLILQTTNHHNLHLPPAPNHCLIRAECLVELQGQNPCGLSPLIFSLQFSQTYLQGLSNLF